MILPLSSADVVVVVVCLVGTIVMAALRKRPDGSAATFTDLALAGRRLTVPAFVATLVATWYGAVLSVGEFVTVNGIVAVLCMGVPYYLAAVVFALYVAPKVRAATETSIPERMTAAYGRPAGFVAALLVFVLSSPAPYVLMAGTVIASTTGLPVVPSMITITVVSMAYVIKGGLDSDVGANIVQVILMFLGYGLLLGFAMAAYGGVGTLFAAVVPERLAVPGPVGWWGIAGWWIIALQTFVDPNIHQRVAAAGSVRTARRGMLWSVAAWICFDVLTIGTGMYACTFLVVDNPVHAHLVLADAVLPSGIRGIFVGGILAAILSTLDGYALANGMTLSHDIVDAWWRRASTPSTFRWSLVVVATLAVILAVVLPSVIDMFFYLATIALPGLLVPLLLSYTVPVERLRRGAALRMALPSVFTTVLVLAPLPASMAMLGDPAIAMLVGLSCSVLWHGAVFWRRRRV